MALPGAPRVAEVGGGRVRDLDGAEGDADADAAPDGGGAPGAAAAASPCGGVVQIDISIIDACDAPGGHGLHGGGDAASGGGGAHSGISSTALAAALARELPPLAPLVLVVKRLLRERGLADAYVAVSS